MRVSREELQLSSTSRMSTWRLQIYDAVSRPLQPSNTYVNNARLKREDRWEMKRSVERSFLRHVQPGVIGRFMTSKDLFRKSLGRKG